MQASCCSSLFEVRARTPSMEENMTRTNTIGLEPRDCMAALLRSGIEESIGTDHKHPEHSK